MEEIEKLEELETETETEETSPESESEETEEESEESEEKDIDHKKELEKLETEKPKSELEKAQKALHFNAERLKELGGDPAEVLKIKKAETPDVTEVVQRQFAERDAKALSKTEDEYKLIMWYVDNRKLPVEDAYILANKGKLQRSILEAKRSQVDFGKPSLHGKKADTSTVPTRSIEEVALLERRGMRLNPKTKTYQGKFYEEFWNGTAWESRKLPK